MVDSTYQLEQDFFHQSVSPTSKMSKIFRYLGKDGFLLTSQTLTSRHQPSGTVTGAWGQFRNPVESADVLTFPKNGIDTDPGPVYFWQTKGTKHQKSRARRLEWFICGDALPFCKGNWHSLGSMVSCALYLKIYRFRMASTILAYCLPPWERCSF